MTPFSPLGTVYLVTNRLSTSLLIHDIGVRLDAGGSKLLPEQTYNASKTIQEYILKGWVNVSQRQTPVKPPVPVWPFSKAPSPPPPPPMPPSPPAMDPAVLQLVAELKGMISTLAAASTRAPAPIIGQTAAAVPAAMPIAQPSDEPMFIPKTILPTGADVSINVAKSETTDQDFDSGLEALKKARKK